MMRGDHCHIYFGLISFYAVRASHTFIDIKRRLTPREDPKHVASARPVLMDQNLQGISIGCYELYDEEKKIQPFNFKYFKDEK